MSYRLERLTDAHPVRAFTSGSHPGSGDIDAFLHALALEEQRLGWSRVTVAIDTAATAPSEVIVGFFSLSPLSIRIDPTILQAMGLAAAAYPVVGGYLLGRMGVAASRQGQGYGRLLLERAIDAARTASQASGGVFLAVDAKNEKLVQWYLRLDFGFKQLRPGQHRLVVKL